MLLDVCCGTGTIGQVYAKQVAQVHGFELVADAIEDAKINAKLNGAGVVCRDEWYFRAPFGVMSC